MHGGRGAGGSHEEASGRVILREEAPGRGISRRLRLPRLREHALLQGGGPRAQVAVLQVLAPARREEGHDDGRHPSRAHEMAHGHLAGGGRQARDRRIGAPGLHRLQLQDFRRGPRTHQVRHGQIGVRSMSSQLGQRRSTTST